ncbi:Extended-spectrum beta-lactamase PER-1 [Dyadobacter sp. CECT 9275]|uniref:beta-lactamase n=1 Tax=Dyadobacter helix TaxID=2822344 RepID=A0A916J7A4_9BACT|nr:class A beta-lactamase [Dyadobacter sp. CECT 9275]CAG4990418.1 Extended-spectrum beta-lactamase PER-1 [Dyadobacter sp. CECT 9275]
MFKGLNFLFLVGMTLLVASTGFAQTGKDIAAGRLEREMERIAKLAKGKVGIYAVHLESGMEVSMNLKERFPMASTVKVAIAVQLLKKIEKGELSLMTMVDLQPSDLHPGSGTLDVLFAKPGVQLSVQNLLELMMTISDNSATDILLRLAGGAEAVRDCLKNLGIQGMSVDRTIIQLIADLEGITLPPQEQWVSGFYSKLWETTTPASRLAAEMKLRTDPRDTSTPEAMVNLLSQIYKGTALQPESRDLLLAVMERCKGGTARIKGYLPPETVVAHKTGTLNASATDDVGIITLPDHAGHIAIAVFVASSAQPMAEREQTIAHLSRTVYDYFLFQQPVTSAYPR